MDQRNKSDISRYVTAKLPKSLAAQNSDPVRAIIVQKAEGVFLWAVLIIEVLIRAEDAGEPMDSMMKMLDRAPGELNEVFKQILDRVDMDTRPDTLLLMQWVLLSQEPLTPLEVLSVLRPDAVRIYSVGNATSGVTFPPDSRRMERLIRSLSGGMVEVKLDSPLKRGLYDRYGLDDLGHLESYVQFIHESVRDFPIRGNGFQALDPQIGTNPAARSYEALTESCIHYLRNVVLGFSTQVLDTSFCERHLGIFGATGMKRKNTG